MLSMKRQSLFLLIFINFIILNLNLLSQVMDELPRMPPDSPEVIPINEIKEGMEGVGYTVVQGTNVQPFKVKVISILRKTWNGSDAILITLEGLNLEHSGTVAGMSGSPIYFDGRIAGALAFGWNYAKDPIAGVTPIEEMYKLYSDTNIVPTIAYNSDNSLKTPLLFSGFNNFTFSKYSKQFEKDGFYPMQSGGAISDTNQDKKFLFGDSAAIVLVDGDLSIAAIGTVSHTDNDKFLLFGHSMWAKGGLRAPVSRAYINSVIASTVSSFKLGNAYSNYLGYTVYDGTFGVSGVYGKLPESTMIPVSLTIEDRDFLSETLHFRVLNDSTYFPKLLPMAIMEGITSRAGNEEEGTFSISYEIETDYFDEPYKITDRIVSYSSIEAYKNAIASVLSPINFFIYNTFGRVGIKSIKMSIKRNNIEYAFLNDITLVESQAKAGDTIHLKIGLTEYGKEKTYVTIPVSLPINLSSGNYVLFAGNEYIFNLAEQTFMPSKYTIRSLDDVIRIYGKSYNDKTLKVWLYSSSRGVQIGKNSYPLLPPSRYGILARDATSDKAAVISAIDGENVLPYSILGILNINLYIEGAQKYENR